MLIYNLARVHIRRNVNINKTKRVLPIIAVDLGIHKPERITRIVIRMPKLIRLILIFNSVVHLIQIHGQFRQQPIDIQNTIQVRLMLEILVLLNCPPRRAQRDIPRGREPLRNQRMQIPRQTLSHRIYPDDASIFAFQLCLIFGCVSPRALVKHLRSGQIRGNFL